jgi:hypothetical protein
MWALGISLYETITNGHPFAKMNLIQKIITIRTWSPDMQTHRPLSNDMSQLIIRL